MSVFIKNHWSLHLKQKVSNPWPQDLPAEMLELKLQLRTVPHLRKVMTKKKGEFSQKRLLK